MLKVEINGFWYARHAPPTVYDCKFDVGQNEFVSVVGESGGGKTTILRLCCGLLQSQIARTMESHFVLDGAVSFGDCPVTSPHPSFSYVPQRFYLGLHPMKNAIENVLLTVLQDGTSPSEREDALQLLETSGIIDVAHLRVGKLSGGQQQRVAICRALIKKPKILFMDEPFANLDTTLRPGMIILLKKLRNKYDSLAIVAVTHDIEAAIQLSDKILGVKQTYSIPEYVNFYPKGLNPDKLREKIVKWMDPES